MCEQIYNPRVQLREMLVRGDAYVKKQLDVHPSGSTRYNTRARIDLESVCRCVGPAGSTRCNALARKHVKRAGSSLGKPRLVSGKSSGKGNF